MSIYSVNRQLTILLLTMFSSMVLLLSSSSLLAAVEVFERDYLYNASENDSKVSARNAALQQLKTLLIEEVGVQVSSSLNIADTVQGDDFNRNVVANYKTFAQALTKTSILEEKWNGEEFYLKARIEVDTDNLVETIQLIYQGNMVSSQPKVDPCEATSNQVAELIKNSHRQENIDRLIELSLAHPIDEACYRWQWSVLSQFRSLETESDPYRQYLFEQTVKETSSFKGDLLLAVLSYAMRLKPLSEDEWQSVIKVMSDIEVNDVLAATGLLVNMTQTEDTSKFSEMSLERDARKQTKEQLLAQVSELIVLASSAQLGLTKEVSAGDIVLRTLNNLSKKRPTLFIDVYNAHAHELSDSQYQALAWSLYSVFKKDKTVARAQLVISYLNNVNVNSKVSKIYFGLLESLDKERLKSAQSKDVLDLITTSVKKLQLFEIVSQARTQQKKKNLWAIRLQLNGMPVCNVTECAQQLFKPNNRSQQDAAEYLAAYGHRAVDARSKVLKKLERVRVQFPVQGPTRIIVPLLKVIEATGISDQRSVTVMLWALGSMDKAVSKQAESSLEAKIDEALPYMVNSYDQLKSVAKRRMIQVVGKATSNKELAKQFLDAIQPEDAHTKFAIEDAVEMLSGEG